MFLLITLFVMLSSLIVDKGPMANPFRQPKPGAPKPVAFKTAMVAHNADGNGNFVKLTYKPSGYLTAVNYLDKQPLDKRKLGFGTKDAFKSDEFTNAIRTSQHRESIHKEMVRAKDGMEARTAEILAKLGGNIEEQKVEKIAQYDIGRTRVTPFNAKSKQDSYYKFDEENGKRMGMYKPVSTEYGSAAWTTKYQSPAHGGRSEVSQFFDNSHLTVDRTGTD